MGESDDGYGSFRPERRRRWTSAEKLRIVEESLAGGASVAGVARQHDVYPNLLNTWRRQARTGALVSVAAGGCRFTPVTVAPDRAVIGATRSGAAAEPAIEVVLRNGRLLRGRFAGTGSCACGRAGGDRAMMPIPSGVQVWLRPKAAQPSLRFHQGSIKSIGSSGQPSSIHFSMKAMSAGATGGLKSGIRRIKSPPPNSPNGGSPFSDRIRPDLAPRFGPGVAMISTPCIGPICMNSCSGLFQKRP